MLYCEYCKRKVDERCDLCIYKKEAKEVDDGIKSNLQKWKYGDLSAGKGIRDKE